jgi:hypothetical protein
VTPREQEFHQGMGDIYRLAKEECSYNAARFLQMLGEYGGLGTGKRLLASDAIQYGFTELWLCHRLDLTVEAYVISDKFRVLFTREEIKRAEERLRSHNYGFPRGYQLSETAEKRNGGR